MPGISAYHRKNMYQILNLTAKNAEVCPAVAEILNRITVKSSMSKKKIV